LRGLRRNDVDNASFLWRGCVRVLRLREFVAYDACTSTVMRGRASGEKLAGEEPRSRGEMPDELVQDAEQRRRRHGWCKPARAFAK
jgi:hypothetical protein